MHHNHVMMASLWECSIKRLSQALSQVCLLLTFTNPSTITELDTGKGTMARDSQKNLSF